jgi:hypothetical protein
VSASYADWWWSATHAPSDPLGGGFGKRLASFIKADVLVFQTRTGKSPGPRNALGAMQTAAGAAGLPPKKRNRLGLMTCATVLPASP